MPIIIELVGVLIKMLYGAVLVTLSLICKLVNMLV